MGEGSDLSGDLCLVGRAAAPGSRHPRSGLLLGLHEGQSAAPELHIELPRLTVAHPHLNLPGRTKKGFKVPQKQIIYLNPGSKCSSPVALPFSQLCF